MFKHNIFGSFKREKWAKNKRKAKLDTSETGGLTH